MIMKVTIAVFENTALVAVMHNLSMDIKITSKKKFKEAVAGYIDVYGVSCTDDHESECSNYRKEAKEIIKKYFPKSN